VPFTLDVLENTGQHTADKLKIQKIHKLSTTQKSKQRRIQQNKTGCRRLAATIWSPLFGRCTAVIRRMFRRRLCTTLYRMCPSGVNYNKSPRRLVDGTYGSHRLKHVQQWLTPYWTGFGGICWVVGNSAPYRHDR